MTKIYLSDTDKKIAGVCGGIAEAYDLDSTLIRLAAVFIALVTAIIPAIITYIVASLIIPARPKQKVHEDTTSTTHTTAQ